ncbi:MAG: glycosyltransferase family 4 protein [Patescibacteria group bacterium]
MKILLAAGVFFPDVGGPAIHVRKIAERLVEAGFRVRVVAYGDDEAHTEFSFKVSRVSRKFPKVIQWFLYFSLCLWHAPTSRIIYAFDPTAAGLPARLVALIFHRPFIIRVGGDPIWEREAEMGRRLMPLEKYYEQGLHKQDKPELYRIIRWVLKGARKVIVYNQNFKNFYMKYFGVLENRIVVIKNPVFKRESASPGLPVPSVVLFAGRFVAYKNLAMVVRAFHNIGKGKLLLIGSGPEEDKLHGEGIVIIHSLPQEKLFEHIREAAVCIGPALSEFNPNFILEALSFGKPVLISRGHGLSVELPEEMLFNPLSQEDFETKLKNLLEEENYQKAIAKVASLPLNHSWEAVTGAHLALINDIIRK